MLLLSRGGHGKAAPTARMSDQNGACRRGMTHSPGRSAAGMAASPPGVATGDAREAGSAERRERNYATGQAPSNSSRTEPGPIALAALPWLTGCAGASATASRLSPESSRSPTVSDLVCVSETRMS